jgi:dTDP-4-amino-4,6-dideoxygalactose transaminase
VITGTYNLDPEDVERRIGPRTRAVLLVHQIGIPADIDRFSALCKRHGLILIEDAACAAGSAYKGNKIGSHSELVCFSFHPRKVISTGDGGMITTNREDYYVRLKRLRQHGMSVNDRVRHESKTLIFESHLEVGFNYRLTDVQAAIGIRQLEKLDKLVRERRKIAALYREAFEGLDCLAVHQEGAFEYLNYQSYSILLLQNCPVKRDNLILALFKRGISSRRGVMTIHREPAYQSLCSDTRLPHAEYMHDNSIILPLYYPMKRSEVDYVVDAFISQLMSVHR